MNTLPALCAAVVIVAVFVTFTVVVSLGLLRGSVRS